MPSRFDLQEFQAVISYARHAMVECAARSAESSNLAGESTAPTYKHWQGEIGRAIAQLKAAHAEIESLKGHSHEWNNSDYCAVCGADGRA